MAVMVAEGRYVRSLIWLGVIGSPAPSITARQFNTLSGKPNEACIARSISSYRACPARIKVATASVAVGSPSGYSSLKSSPTRTTPWAAWDGDGTPVLPARRRRRGSVTMPSS